MASFTIFFPIFNGPYGGERHCLKLAEGLALRGHHVAIWTFGFKKSCTPLLSDKVSLRIVKHQLPAAHPLAVLMSLARMPMLARAAQKDMPQTKDNYMIGMGWQSVRALAALPDTLYKIYYCLEPPRFLYDLSTMQPPFIRLALRLIGPLLRMMDRRNMQCVTHIFSNSDWTQKQIRTIYNKESIVIYPGIETKRFQRIKKPDARRNLNIPVGIPIYLSVGKLHIRKRIDRSIDLFAERETQSDARLIIIGSGPARPMIEKLIRGLSADIQNRIFLLGEVSDTLVATYVIAADYLLFTAKDEPFGLVVLEAKAAGCTILPEDRNLPVQSWEQSTSAFLHAIQ